MIIKATLAAPFEITVESIDNTSVCRCDCPEEKRGSPCEHDLEPVLLVDASGQWSVGRWNGEGWYAADGRPVEPIAWAWLPDFDVKFWPET